MLYNANLMLLSEIGGKTTANLSEIGGKISEICWKSEASAPPNFGEMAEIAVLNFGEMEFFSVNRYDTAK